jgi:hypothetical protein
MKSALIACEKCGLREVSHEFEKKGVIIRFCEECYWGEISETGEVTAAPSAKRAGQLAASGRESA